MDNKYLALGLLPLLAGCSGTDKAPKNVLFIMVDDLKPIMGCYGDEMVQTPNIDAFAEDGCLYTNAYCQQAISGPTRASILTGLRPDTEGVLELTDWIRAKIPDVITMPQTFKEAGYCSVSVGKTFHGEQNTLDSLSWSTRPVLYIHDAYMQYQLPENQATGGKAAAYEFADGPEENYLDMQIRAEAIRVLDSLATGDDPFFLAVGFLKPHLPFCAPKRFWDMYEGSDFGQIDTSMIIGAPSLAYHNYGELRGYTDIPSVGPMSLSQQAELKKGYYACATFADENIGAVLNELKRLGLYDDTVIVLLGDHGYHTGEQGLWNKHTNYEAATHVPLIIKGSKAGHKVANIPNPLSGGRCNVPVEFVDIFPTVAELAGISAPEGLEGKSLMQLEEGVQYHAFSQFGRNRRGSAKVQGRTHRGYSVRDSRWRYVEWIRLEDSVVVDEELYDLGPNGDHNVLEVVNLAGDPAYKPICDSLARVISSDLGIRTHNL